MKKDLEIESGIYTVHSTNRIFVKKTRPFVSLSFLKKMDNNIVFIDEDKSKNILKNFIPVGNVVLRNRENGAVDKRIYYGGAYKGYYMDVTTVNGAEEGPGIIHNPEGLKFADLVYKGGKLNGRYAFFHEGELFEDGTAKNNVKDGICRSKHQDKFDIYEFRQGEIYAEIKEYNRNWRMYSYRNINSSTIEMIVQYDSTFKRHGLTIHLNNGQYEKLSEYHQDRYMNDRKKFRFFNGKLHCTEFDDNGNKVYEGECSDNIEHVFPREGMGKEYNGVNGSIIFDGFFYQNQWYSGKLYDSHGSLIYQGNMWNNMPHQEGTVFMNGQPIVRGQWVSGYLDLKDNTAIDWNYPRHRISITQLLNSEEYRLRQNLFLNNPFPVTLQLSGPFSGMYREVSIMNISDDCCNDQALQRVDFSDYSNLMEIHIGSRSFQNVKRVFISNLRFLKEIVVGTSSFAPPMHGSVAIDINNPECHITRCLQLHRIDIGPGSFAAFSTLEIKYLHQLQVLRIGRQATPNPCFCFVSELHLRNFPRLEEIELGGYSFIRCKDIILSGMPFLKRMHIGDCTMQGDDKTLVNNKIQLFCMFEDDE